MEKPNPLQIQDFLLFITSQNTLLTLEVEHQATEKIFTINLDSDSIGQVTNGLFDSVDNMVQGLKDATSGSYEGLTLTISSQGKLTYSVVLASGVIKKEFSFTLNLAEKEMEPIEIFTRRLNSVKGELEKWEAILETKVETQDTQIETFQTFQARSEERLDRLENMMMQMDQKMTQRLDLLEKLHETLKASIVFKPDSYFNDASVNASKYFLSNFNKTAKGAVDGYSCLEVLPPVPSNGISSYSFRINTEAKEIAFGVTTEPVKSNWNDEKCSYWYSTKTGAISGRSTKGANGHSPFGGNEKILKMVVDMDQGILNFFVDGRQINSCNISKSEKYFAYLSLGAKEDSVSLI